MMNIIYFVTMGSEKIYNSQSRTKEHQFLIKPQLSPVSGHRKEESDGSKMVNEYKKLSMNINKLN
jgi:hypothetical protein